MSNLYGPIQMALTNLNNQVNINYERRRQQELDLNTAAMNRLNLELKFSDPVRRQRIQVAQDKLRPRTMNLPTFEGSPVRKKNAEQKLSTVIETMIPSPQGGVTVRDGQVFNSANEPILVPNWMAERAEVTAKHMKVYLDDPRTKREDRIRSMEDELANYGQGPERMLAKDGRKQYLKQQIKAEKNISPVQRLAEIQLQDKLLTDAMAQIQDLPSKEWFLKAKDRLWDEAKLLNNSLKGDAPGTRVWKYHAIDERTGKPYKDWVASEVLTSNMSPLGRKKHITTDARRLPDGVFWQQVDISGRGKGAGTATKEHVAANFVEDKYQKIAHTNKQKHAIQLFIDNKESIENLLGTGQINETTAAILRQGVPQSKAYILKLNDDIQRLEATVDPENITDPILKRAASRAAKATDRAGIRKAAKNYTSESFQKEYLQ